MSENPEQFCNSITAQAAESTESATALENEVCLTTEIMQC